MAEFESKLGRKKEAAILALLSARSVEDAARTAKVPARTLYRWMNEPDFDLAFRKAKRIAFGQSLARLQQSSGAATSTMLKIMVDPGTPASTRLRAADCVYTHAKQGIEIEDIEARLTELERAAEQNKTDKRK
jgi:hypothetical protein